MYNLEAQWKDYNRITWPYWILRNKNFLVFNENRINCNMQ